MKKYKLAIITLSIIALIAVGVVEYVKYLMNAPAQSISEYLQLKAPEEKISNSRNIKDQGNNDIVKYSHVSEIEAQAKTIKTDNDANIAIPSEFNAENKNIPLWTDDNTNENLIIQSDKKYYYGRDSSIIYFSITNTSLDEQEPRLRFLFDNEENRGVKSITQLNNKDSLILASGQSNFYSAAIYYPENAQGEFFIEAKGSNGGYGYLDPYYAGNLAAYWSFDGPDMDWASITAEALDTSGNSRNGNVVGAKAAIGQSGQGMEFDGIDDYVDAGNVYDGVKTIAFWIKADDTDDTTYFDGKLDEIYFYSQALNVDQIGQLYRVGARRTIIGNYSSSGNEFSSARPTSKIFDLNGTANIEVSSGTITANGFTSPTIYVDGSATSTIDDEWRFVAITTDTGINASAVNLGKDIPPWACEDALAYGGQDYTTVLIGDQCWFAENLNVTDGNEDQTCTFTRYCYDNNSANCDIYGGLYQWADIMCGEASSNSEPSGVQGICPNGWHIPSHYEWITLERQVCSGIGNTGCDTTFPKDLTTGYFGQDTTTAEGEGSAMAGNEPLWTNGDIDNAGAGNNDFGTSGLGVLPAGYRNTDGSYSNLSHYTYIWSSLESDANAWRRYLFYNHTDVYRGTNDKLYGFSVRCLKD